MTNTSITQTTRRAITGCSFALLIAACSSTAFAHGGGGGHSGGAQVGNGGNHFSSAGHGRCVDCGGGKWSGGRDVDSDYWRHHHHHHGSGPGGLGTVHGPGSSHNPIVTHPSKITKPVVGVGPAKPVPGPIVRDHRNHGGTPFPDYCNANVAHPGCGRIRDHRH